MAKIYVASSWRNQYFPEVVKRLREYGHEVYDFRNPPHDHGAFMWKNVDPNFDKWTVEEYKQGLQHPSSERQFQADLDALNWADTCLLVLPCCTIKHSLKDRLDCSKNFVLIVGNHTNDLTRGSCAYCNSYNSWSRSCGRGHYVSYESFIEYECRQAVEAGMKILILHNSPAIDKTKCPESIRYKGTHIAMHKYDFSKGSYVWDYLGIKSAFEKYLD